MNWVLIVVALILLLNIVQGYRRGFLRILYSLVSWIAVLLFVTWATPHIDSFLRESTSLYQTIEKHCEEKVRESAVQKENEGTDTRKNELLELGINLPEAAAENILEKTLDATDEFLESSGIYEQMAKGVANFVLEGISFFIALAGAWIIVHFISQILGIVSRIPVLNGVNRFLGFFAGGIYGLIQVWVAFYIVAVCGTSEWGSTIISYIYESDFLRSLYENNAVLTVILHYL